MAVIDRFGNASNTMKDAIGTIRKTLADQLDPIKKEQQKEDFRQRYNSLMTSGDSTAKSQAKQTGLLGRSGDRVSDITAINNAKGAQTLGFNQDSQDIGNLQTAGTLQNTIGGNIGKLNLGDENITNNADLYNRTLKAKLKEIMDNRNYANQDFYKNLQNDMDLTKLRADLGVRNDPSGVERGLSSGLSGLSDILGKYLSKKNTTNVEDDWSDALNDPLTIIENGTATLF